MVVYSHILENIQIILLFPIGLHLLIFSVWPKDNVKMSLLLIYLKGNSDVISSFLCSLI